MKKRITFSHVVGFLVGAGIGHLLYRANPSFLTVLIVTSACVAIGVPLVLYRRWLKRQEAA